MRWERLRRKRLRKGRGSGKRWETLRKRRGVRRTRPQPISVCPSLVLGQWITSPVLAQRKSGRAVDGSVRQSNKSSSSRKIDRACGLLFLYGHRIIKYRKFNLETDYSKFELSKDYKNFNWCPVDSRSRVQLRWLYLASSGFTHYK